ncbi:MAG TPA: TolC family protein [Planctomycetaceae bacterium]|nr:TolC family protein [Planctomycetaceae bacterium]
MPPHSMDRFVQRWVAGVLIATTGCTTVPLGGGVVAHRSATPAMTVRPAPRNEPVIAPQPDASIPDEAISDHSTPAEILPVSELTSADSAEAPDVVLPAAIQAEAAPLDDESESSPPAPAGAYTLSLGNVLHLADAQNPNVAVARERINEAYARVERAETLWLPSLRAGLNYNHHEGAIQDVAGNVFNTTRSSFYGGLGANAVGAGSPAVPGVVAQFHLTDAIFQPKIAEHQAASRQFGATAARNDTLRDAAVAYLELVRAEHALAIADEALSHTGKLALLTEQYAETGQGLQSDRQRSEAELALRQDELATRQEAVQVASARLAQVLHADPSVIISSGEPAVVPLDILMLQGSAASYVATGLSRRPELAEQKHLVCEAVERLRRERYAPLVPSVLLGMSYGGLGGGLGSSIVNSDDRWDADAVAYWEVRNLGFGERAARNENASLVRQSQMRELALLDRVAREVTEAHAQVVQRQRRIQLARNGVVAAEKSYALNQQRIENAHGLPIEVLQAIQALATARRAYLNAVVDYNVAQFELCRATGWFMDV